MVVDGVDGDCVSVGHPQIITIIQAIEPCTLHQLLILGNIAIQQGALALTLMEIHMIWGNNKELSIPRGQLDMFGSKFFRGN